MNIEQYATLLGITKADLVGKSRVPPLPLYRQVYCYLIRQSNKDYTLEQIGALINRNHATVSYSCKKITDLIGLEDWEVMELIDKVKFIK